MINDVLEKIEYRLESLRRQYKVYNSNTALGLSNDYLSGEAIRIYVENDTVYDGFRATAITSGSQLVGLNISNAGTDYDDGETCFLLGLEDDDVWFPGNQINLRGVASNSSGVSSSDTSENPTIGS